MSCGTSLTAVKLGFAGFFFQLIKPVLRMGGQPAIRQQGFQGIYLISRGLRKQEFIGTCAWLFLVVSCGIRGTRCPAWVIAKPVDCDIVERMWALFGLDPPRVVLYSFSLRSHRFRELRPVSFDLMTSAVLGVVSERGSPAISVSIVEEVSFHETALHDRLVFGIGLDTGGPDSPAGLVGPAGWPLCAAGAGEATHRGADSRLRGRDHDHHDLRQSDAPGDGGRPVLPAARRGHDQRLRPGHQRRDGRRCGG